MSVIIGFSYSGEGCTPDASFWVPRHVLTRLVDAISGAVALTGNPSASSSQSEVQSITGGQALFSAVDPLTRRRSYGCVGESGRDDEWIAEFSIIQSSTHK